MYHLSKAVATFLFLYGGIETVQSKELKGQAAAANFIIHEKYYNGFTWQTGLKSITSNVPVTIQRYSDDYYMEGEQPVDYNEAKVLITSDCAGTTYVPQVTFGPDSIDVNVQGAPSDMPYLDSSSYDAEWDYENYWCRYYTPAPTMDPVRPPRLNENRPFTLKDASLPSSIKKFVKRIMRQNEKSTEADESAEILSSYPCNVNVDIMYDGCTHDVQVSAPTVRVIDSVLENQSSEQSSEDECIYDYEADITFPGEPALEGTQLLDVPSVTCHRAVPGRPFVDSTGSTLQATSQIEPYVAASEMRGWSSGEDHTELVKTIDMAYHDNTTLNQNQLLLGEEWTKSALGEHASVASFSAFSIALMTNEAPSDLVEDAINAALDEVRHARTSFKIASRLTGKDIRPGPLPESNHTFEHDLEALALAVAQQGCIDETLSALEAAAEVNLINEILEDGHEADESKYSGIDKDILTWIRDELHTIAMEESNHAALAWSTFKWVCRVEPDICHAVNRHVLSDEKLDIAFERRFRSFGGNDETYDAMKETWGKIYSSYDVDSRECAADVGTFRGKEQLVSTMVQSIISAGVVV